MRSKKSLFGKFFYNLFLFYVLNFFFMFYVCVLTKKNEIRKKLVFR